MCSQNKNFVYFAMLLVFITQKQDVFDGVHIEVGCCLTCNLHHMRRNKTNIMLITIVFLQGVVGLVFGNENSTSNEDR